MVETEFQARLRQKLGLRVGPEMAKFLMRRMGEGSLGESAISAMGGDARTGVPVMRTIPIQVLKNLAREDRPSKET